VVTVEIWGVFACAQNGPFWHFFYSLVGPPNSQILWRGTIACGGIDMNQNFTAVVKQDGPWWIGWVEEFPGVSCQERTRDELLNTLRVTLKEALEMN
jgi:hypothetical protein